MTKTLADGEVIQWFTGMAGPRLEPSSFSMSAVHFSKHRFSFAVIYNGNAGQELRTQILLHDSLELSSHALLFPWLFAELQLDRISAQTNSIKVATDGLIGKLAGKDRENMTTENKAPPELLENTYQVNRMLRAAVQDVHSMQQTVVAARNQLQKFINRAGEYKEEQQLLLSDSRQNSTKTSAERLEGIDIDITKRFENRLGEIDLGFQVFQATLEKAARDLDKTSDLAGNSPIPRLSEVIPTVLTFIAVPSGGRTPCDRTSRNQ